MHKTHAEIEAIGRQIDALKAEYRRIFPKKEIFN